jgi:hypothetical protein
VLVVVTACQVVSKCLAYIFSISFDLLNIVYLASS